MNIKTKEEFLLQLKRHMKYRFRWKEIYDTLEDFNGFFETGKSEGKTEEELCLEFGSPKEIVNQMVSAEQKRYPLHLVLSFLLLIISGIICIVLAAESYRISSPMSYALLLCVPVLLIAVLLLFFYGGIDKHTAGAKPVSRKFPVLFVLTVLLAFFLYLFSIAGLRRLMTYSKSENAGITARNVFLFFLLLGMVFFLYGAFSFLKEDIFLFGAAIQGMGLSLSAYGCIQFLHRMDNQELTAGIFLLPYGFSLLLSLLFLMAVFGMRKERN